MKDRIALLRALVALTALFCHAAFASGAELLLLVGTADTGPGAGLSVARFDTETGALSEPKLVYETPAPTFLVPDATGSRVYVSHEFDGFEGVAQGFVSVFAIDRTTRGLHLLNQAGVGSRGAAHVNLDRTGRVVLVANYGGGSISALATGSDGRLAARTALIQHEGRGADPDRQAAPHPHSIYPDPGNNYVVVPDLGLDKILVYRLDARTGELTPHPAGAAWLRPASGPRHLAWHPNGRFAYVAEEIANAVTVLQWDQVSGVLAPGQTISTLPRDFEGRNYAAEITVHPSGRFLYASNRGDENSIALFSIDAEGAQLTHITSTPSHGEWPRNFTIDPDGAWMVVSNHRSDNLIAFRIDAATGRLERTGAPVPARRPFGTRFLATPVPNGVF